MDIETWLRGLGLQHYLAAFRDNAIDAEILPELTDADLEKIGVVLGHRKRLLKAIATLAAPAPVVKATPVGSARSPGDGAERRHLTVMFCDLVGSTALSARMDPEDLREVISTYQKCVAKTVRRFDGFLAKYMGDGVLVYFGYPRAHEDDAERAVRAGLSLVEVVGQVQSADHWGCVSGSPPASWLSAISSARAGLRNAASSARPPTWLRDCRLWPSQEALSSPHRRVGSLVIASG